MTTRRIAPQQLVVDRAEVPEVDPVIARGALADRLGHRVRLLVDLLEHERLVALLLGRVGVPVDLDDLALERRAVGGQELDAVGAQDDDLVVARCTGRGASRAGTRGSPSR